MTDRSAPQTNPASLDALPEVTLELRQGLGRNATFPIAHVDFLIGTVPGCDLRVPGSELPAVLCLLARSPSGLALRKLAPTQLILVNGKTSTHADLHDGDRITVGASDIFVRLTPRARPAPPPMPVADTGSSSERSAQIAEQDAHLRREREEFLEEQRQRHAELQKMEALLREREARLQSQAAEFDKDRSFWMKRRPEPVADLPNPELTQREERLSLREAEIQDQLADMQRQRQELANVRQELADIRKQLYDRYQERRDRLSGLQEAIDKAARKVQERKRLVDTEEEDVRQRGEQLERDQTRLEEDTNRLTEERRAFQDRSGRLQRELTDQQTDLQTREHRLAADRLELEGMVKHYQADVLRLDRQNDDLQERERRLKAQSEEIERRQTELQHVSTELEQQGSALEQWRARLTQESQQLAQGQAEQQSRAEQLSQRETALEAQQATLTALRTRLERQRDELQRQEQQIEEQRSRLERSSADIERELQECAAQQENLRLREIEFERQTEELEQWRSRLAQNDAAQQARAEQLTQRETVLQTQQTEAAALRARLDQQRDELQIQAQRLDDQHTRQERSAADLERDRQELTGLREKLRVRAADLDARDATIREQTQQWQEGCAALAKREEEWKVYHQATQDDLNQRQRQTEQSEAVLAEQARRQSLRQAELDAQDDSQKRQHEQLQESAQQLNDQRQRLAQERDQFLSEQQQARQEREQAQALFVEMRLQAESFVEQLPEIELRAGTTLERLAQAREQLRDHLGEISAYVRQCQEDTERDSHAIQEKERTLRQHQDEHRLALVSFRQQLIDWQGQVAESKRSAAGLPLNVAPPSLPSVDLEKGKPSPAVERKGPDLSPLAAVYKTSVVAPSVAPAPPARSALEPARPRGEPARPQTEAPVCSWYRGRFRQLAGASGEGQTGGGTGAAESRASTPAAAAAAAANEADDSDAPLIPTRRDILSLTDPADPGDRQLAESLRRLHLIDADTLQALLVETRRQRRPLRQLLLAGGAVTLFQLAHIEAGDLDGLMIGPLQVVDRIRANPLEIVYQVFDPRRRQEAILRHLTPEQLRIATRADDFRSGFRKAILPHPHLAQTLEVLDIAGRPAALQESLAGLTSTDWLPLASVPGVCFRILLQAVQALDAVHAAALVHGHLNENMILLQPDGIVKLCGLGEPAWLTEEQQAARGPASTHQDLLSLGQVVSKWCSPAGIRRGARTKPPPDALLDLVTRLAGTDSSGFPSTADVLGDLEKIRPAIPANPEAWDRLLRHVREHASPAMPLRTSA